MTSTVQSAGNAVQAREPQQERQQVQRYSPPLGKKCNTAEALRPKPVQRPERRGDSNANNDNANNDKPRGNRFGFLPENFRPREPTEYDLWGKKRKAEEREDRWRRKQEAQERNDKLRWGSLPEGFRPHYGK